MDGFLDRYIGARFYYIWYTLLLPPHCDWGYYILHQHVPNDSLCQSMQAARGGGAAWRGASSADRSHICLSKLESLDTSSQRNKRLEHVSRGVITLQKKHYVQANQFQRVPFVYLLPSKNLNGYHST